MSLSASLLPWTDRTGRFAALRAVVFALVLAPAAWLLLEALEGWLGSRPMTEAIHQAGLWSIRLLAVSMAVTPLRVASRYTALVGVRRMLGLATLAYALLHLALYVTDEHFALGQIVWEIVTRIYLLIGFVALSGLVVLGATSTDGAVRRLGAQLWGRLHRIVYAVAALAVVHFFMQSKLDVSQALVMGGIFAGLGLARLARAWRGDLSAVATVLVAILAAGGTALVEAGWYAYKTGAPFAQILAANGDFSYDIRPAWYVLAAGGVLLVARLVRRLFAGRRKPAPRSAETRRPEVASASSM